MTMGQMQSSLPCYTKYTFLRMRVEILENTFL